MSAADAGFYVSYAYIKGFKLRYVRLTQQRPHLVAVLNVLHAPVLDARAALVHLEGDGHRVQVRLLYKVPQSPIMS
jgi:hypothetical protein